MCCIGYGKPADFLTRLADVQPQLRGKEQESQYTKGKERKGKGREGKERKGKGREKGSKGERVGGVGNKNSPCPTKWKHRFQRKQESNTKQRTL